MREGAKKRLVGASVIVALAVIFVPMMFEDASEDAMTSMPPGMVPVLPAEPVFGERLDLGTRLDPAGRYFGADLDAGQESLNPSRRPIESWPVSEDFMEDSFTQEPGNGEVEAEVVFESMLDDPPGSASSRPAESAAVRATPAPPQGDDGLPTWVTQVASLGSAASAEQMVGKLRSEGFTAFVEEADVRGRRYYRVRVGPEASRANAEKTAARLRQTYGEVLIQRYP